MCVWGAHLGLSEEELQVSAAQYPVVLDVAGEVYGAGAMHGAVHLHVAVDDVQVLLLVLQSTKTRNRHSQCCVPTQTLQHFSAVKSFEFFQVKPV